MKFSKLLFLAVLMLAGAGAATAQNGNSSSGGGCSQSPENPTIVLGLLGAGGFAAAAMRNKVTALFAKRNR